MGVLLCLNTPIQLGLMLVFYKSGNVKFKSIGANMTYLKYKRNMLM